MSDLTIAQLRRTLNDIHFAPSLLPLRNARIYYDVQILPFLPDFRVRIVFERPNTSTGEMQTGFSGWALIESDSSTSMIVKTIWRLYLNLLEHELRESFLYDGVRVFDPHKEIV